MQQKRIFLCIASALLCAAMLVSCKGGTPAVGETETRDAQVDTTPVGSVELPDYKQEISALLDVRESAAESFEYTVEKTGVTVTGYIGKEVFVSIPREIDGVAVVAIGDGAFEGMEQLRSLKIPESVTSIGGGILAGCTSIQALETPLLGKGEGDTLFLGALFGAKSFEDNPLKIPASLQHLRLTGSMEVLPAYALYDCNDLLTLSLPQTMRTLEKFSISKCASLTQIDGLERLTEIGEHALSYGTSLESVTFGKELSSIGFAALEGCTGIVEMTVPFVGGNAEENTYLGYIFGASHVDFSKGYYPVALARVTVLEGCRRLGNNAFYECVMLREVVLPNTLEEIGIRAFYACDGLYSIKLPDSLKTIRANAFLACDGLVSVELGNGLSTMEINAFMNCDSLEEIVLPQSLSALPASAFAGCIALSRIDLGGVGTVGAQAFRGCTSLESVTGGESVTFERGNELAKSLWEG